MSTLKLTIVLQDLQDLNQDFRLRHLSRHTEHKRISPERQHPCDCGGLTEDGWVTSMLMSLVLKANCVSVEP